MHHFHLHDAGLAIVLVLIIAVLAAIGICGALKEK
jgi:hypothetical protein